MTAGKNQRQRILTGPATKVSAAAAVSVLITGIGTVVRYGLQIAIAQAVGPSGFGIYLTLRRWSELLAVFSNRGYLGTVVRFLPDYAASGRWGLYRELRRRAVTITGTGAAAVAGLAIAVGLLIVDGNRMALVLAMLTIPGWAALRMIQAVLQAQHEYVRASAIDQIVQPGLMGLALIVTWVIGWTIGLDLLMAAQLASVAAAVVALWVLAQRSAPAEVRDAVDGAHDRLADGSAVTEDSLWRPAARQFYTSQLATIVIGTADLLILAMFVSNTQVGLYGVATRIAFLARVVSTGTDSIVAPRIAAAWTAGDLEGLQRQVDKAILIATPATILLVGLLIPARSAVLGIMGDEFRAAGDVTIILLIGIVVQALTGPCGYVVALTNNERFNARTMLGAAIFLVAACFVAAPTGGILAVAVVATLTNTVWNLVLVAFARKRLGIRCYLHPGMRQSLQRPDWTRRTS